jgi:hypothetical protein
MTAKLLGIGAGGIFVAWFFGRFSDAFFWFGSAVAVISLVLAPAPWFGYDSFSLYSWLEDQLSDEGSTQESWLGGHGGGDGGGGDGGGDGGD